MGVESSITLFVVIGLVCMLLSITAFKEKDYVEHNTRTQESLFKSFGLVLRNKNFVVYGLGDLCSGCGT